MRTRIETSTGALHTAIQAELAQAHEALTAVQLNQQTIMSIHEQLQAAQADIETHSQALTAMANALETIDENQRLLADAIGGLREDLRPRTGLGRIMSRLLIGGDPDHE